MEDGVAAGDQAGEQAYRDASRYRAAVQMPQIVMLQPLSKHSDEAVLPDALVRGKIFSEKFSSHKKSVRKYERGANINRVVRERMTFQSPLRLYAKEIVTEMPDGVFLSAGAFCPPGSSFSRLDMV